MTSINRKEHWENVFKTKALNEVSWFQTKPETSLNFFKELNIPLNAKIIDIGAGDSFLVDHLLDLGYQDITVLDISESAIERAKKRLEDKADKVKWIVSDIIDFNPVEKYDFWHDRAAFHFLTDENEILNYIKTAYNGINENGNLVIGTFSNNGPKKCSGIEIKQYSEFELEEKFKLYFNKIKCFNMDHKTPFDTIQNFVFCSFSPIIKE
jgi:2-polyprenyl-3-methyl-5-hydroxy-6-metoxy-1,4-benzoquinol methylase